MASLVPLPPAASREPRYDALFLLPARPALPTPTVPYRRNGRQNGRQRLAKRHGGAARTALVPSSRRSCRGLRAPASALSGRVERRCLPITDTTPAPRGSVRPPGCSTACPATALSRPKASPFASMSRCGCACGITDRRTGPALAPPPPPLYDACRDPRLLHDLPPGEPDPRGICHLHIR